MILKEEVNEAGEREEAAAARALLRAVREIADKCETIEELRASLDKINML